MALKAHLHLRHPYCTDEAQKAETVLSAVSYYCIIYIYILKTGSLHKCTVAILEIIKMFSLGGVGMSYS